MQSTYRKHHSTDTISLLVINDILRRIDLPPRCRISTPWFSSGLWHYWPYDSSGRKNRVLLCFLKTDTELVHILPWKPTGINNYWRSSVHSCALCYGVQQGSVLGPLLFTLHVYAHDTQLYIAFDPANQAPSLTAFQICMDDVMRLNTQNMLRSDAEKTEVILFTPRFTKTPNIEKLFFDSTVIDLTERVRDLGVILDKNLRLIYHINETCRKETNAIRSIGRIRKYLTNGNLKLLFNALVISRLNYCKSILYSLPKQNWTDFKELKPLQRALLLKLNNMKSSTLLFENYTGCQLNHVYYSKLFVLLLRFFTFIHFFVLLVVPVTRIPSTTKSSSILQVTFYCPHSYGERAFSFCASALWNTLPDSL